MTWLVPRPSYRVFCSGNNSKRASLWSGDLLIASTSSAILSSGVSLSRVIFAGIVTDSSAKLQKLFSVLQIAGCRIPQLHGGGFVPQLLDAFVEFRITVQGNCIRKMSQSTKRGEPQAIVFRIIGHDLFCLLCELRGSQGLQRNRTECPYFEGLTFVFQQSDQ